MHLVRPTAFVTCVVSLVAAANLTEVLSTHADTRGNDPIAAASQTGSTGRSKPARILKTGRHRQTLPVPLSIATY